MTSEPVDPRSARPIAFFIPGLNGGGAQKAVVNLANALASMSDRPIHLVLARRAGPFVNDLEDGVAVIDLGTRRASRSLFALASYIRRTRPICIISSLNYANVVCLMANEVAGHESAVLVREDNVLRPPTGPFPNRIKSRVVRVLMRLLYRRAHAIIAISRDVRDTLVAARIGTPSKTVLIGNPVVVGEEPCTLPEVSGLPPAGTRFICGMGRLAEQKGFDILLNAFSRLPQRELNLVILGEGEMASGLHDLAGELGVDDRVYFPGFVNPAEGILRQAAAFVLSSRWEGCPLSLIEGLGAGVPVVSTDCAGASRDILADGVYGYLVPSEDPAALAEAIEEALVAPACTREMSERRAREFSSTEIAKEYIARALPDLE